MLEHPLDEKEGNGFCAPPGANGDASCNGHAPCGHETDGHEANGSCNGDAAPVELLRLAEVLERFGKEAKHGVVDTGRYACPYYEWGAGPPLVFVHGLCDDAMSFVLPIARLSERFRCIAYDLPAGREDGAQLSAYRHEDHVADLFALLDHLGLEQANLFGSSFGSTIALSAMHRQPGRFPRAVLQGGFARRPLAPAEVLLANWARWWPWAMKWLPFRLEILKHAHYGPFQSRPPELWQFFLQRDADNPMDAVARRALLVHQTDLRSLLKDIAQPILLVCGDCDPLVGKDCESDLLRDLRNVMRVEIELCGHMPQYTHPEVLAAVVGGFLRESSM